MPSPRPGRAPAAIRYAGSTEEGGDVLSRRVAVAPRGRSSRLGPLSWRTFDSLTRYRNFRLYFAGQTVSQLGSWLQSAAQAWMVLELTHSAFAVGLVTFWQLGPYTLLGLVGGAISDRLDHRRSLIATQAGLGLCAVALAAIAFAHVHAIDAIYAVAAARGTVMVLNNPSEQAFLLRMVGRERLTNAISLNAGSMNATRVVGPALAGVLIAVAGVGVCFALNALSFGAVIVSLLLVREAELFPLVRRVLPGGVLADLREGFAYALRTPRIWVSLGVLAVISTLGINFSVMLPILAAQTLHSDAEVYGLITALFGLGALGGALLAASLGRPTWALVLGSGLLFSLFEIVLAPLSALGPVVPVLVATGFGYTLYAATTNAMVQLSAPDGLQGRVMGLYNWIFFGTGPLGALLSGGLSAAGGTELVFLLAGVGGVLVVLLAALVVRREVRPPTLSLSG